MATFPRKSGALSPSSSNTVTSRVSWISLMGLEKKETFINLFKNPKALKTIEWYETEGKLRDEMVVLLTMWILYSTLGWVSCRWCEFGVGHSPVLTHRKDRSSLGKITTMNIFRTHTCLYTNSTFESKTRRTWFCHIRSTHHLDLRPTDLWPWLLWPAESQHPSCFSENSGKPTWHDRQDHVKMLKRTYRMEDKNIAPCSLRIKIYSKTPYATFSES